MPKDVKTSGPVAHWKFFFRNSLLKVKSHVTNAATLRECTIMKYGSPKATDVLTVNADRRLSPHSTTPTTTHHTAPEKSHI